MDRDTTKHKGSHDRIFQEFRTGKADVLIGTQMLAKGLHFPAVTLVGILGADHSLYIPDFRANEQTYQLISQVAGRSGRGQLPGEVIIQSFLFDHPVIHLAAQNNYKGFIEKELEERKSFGYPPFIRLLKLTFHGKDPKQTFAAATRYLDQLRPKLPPNYTLLPLATAGKAKIKDTYRFQALLKGPNPLAITPLLPPAKHVLIDVDPLSTY